MIKKIISTLIDYLETKLEIYKLQAKEEAARALTVIILIILFSMIGLLFALFISLFIGQLLNWYLESNYLGYLIISVFYLLTGIFIYSFRNKIYEGVENAVFSDNEEK